MPKNVITANRSCALVSTLRGCTSIAVAVAGLVAVRCTTPVEAPTNPTEYTAQVKDLKARYDRDIDRVVLSWTPPPEGATFYGVFRVTPVDLAKAQGDDIPYPLVGIVPGEATTYADVLDLAQGWYFYKMVPYRVEKTVSGADTLRDTIQGYISDTISVKTGIELLFSLNRGATDVASRACTLFVTDSANVGTRVRFTQVTQDYLYHERTGDSVLVNIFDPDHPAGNDELAVLMTTGWLETSGAYKKEVRRVTVPVFEAPDHENDTGPFDLGEKIENAFPWLLEKGSGRKFVFAEITYQMTTDTGKVTRVDTLDYEVPIRPYRVRTKMRNKMGTSDATMIQMDQPNTTSDIDWYILNRPWVKFSILIDGDTTIAPDFDYWLLFPAYVGELGTKISDSTRYWIQTVPRRGKLTHGGGREHDERHIYEYSLDTTTAEGRANLEDLTITTAHPSTDDAVQDIVWPIVGESTPGSYFGENPKIWSKEEGKRYVDIQHREYGTPGENYRRIMQLQKFDMVKYGRKEFAIVLRFRGKSFGDVRTVLSGSNLAASGGRQGSTAVVSLDSYIRTYFDFFAPKITNASISHPDYVTNGDTISNVFNFVLDAEGSAADGGKARIEEVKLVIAYSPPTDTFTWNYWEWDNNIVPPITLEQMLARKSIVLPFDVRVRETGLQKVRWEAIDPSGWDSGNYFIGVVTRDEFGNEGLAPMNYEERTFGTNPMRVVVMTGK